MRLIRGIEQWPPGQDSGCVASIGNFDGVHRGHQAMFAQLLAASTTHRVPATVISFEPLPHEYFAGDEAPARLQGLRDRVDAIAACGVDRLLLMTFDQSLASQSAEAFVTNTLCNTLGVRHLVVGDDFRFGHKRQGDFELLTQLGARLGFDVERNDTVTDRDSRISSTRLRGHLEAGELDHATRILGRPYRISGRVVHGEKVGRQLGFPTANVALHRHRPPLRGVFAVLATDTQSGQAWPAVANLGERPTVGGRKLLLEVHLLDATEALYGRHLHVDFLHFLRGEKRFDGLDELKAAIAADTDQARQLLTGIN